MIIFRWNCDGWIVKTHEEFIEEVSLKVVIFFTVEKKFLEHDGELIHRGRFSKEKDMVEVT